MGRPRPVEGARPAAAGTALGIVVAGLSWSLVLMLVLSVASLALIHRVLRPWLEDLY